MEKQWKRGSILFEFLFLNLEVTNMKYTLSNVFFFWAINSLMFCSTNEVKNKDFCFHATFKSYVRNMHITNYLVYCLFIDFS